MGYDILPFMYIDGVPTFTDSEIMALYDQMETEGFANDVFGQGDANNRDEFLDLVKSKHNIFHAGFSREDGSCLGMFWVNRFEMKTARMHFFIFKAARCFSDQLIKSAAEHIYSLEDNGEPLFTMLVGVVKSTMVHVINYICRNGGVVVGEIPDYYWDALSSKPTAATIVYYPRNEQDEDLHKD